jgi:hypothetical protein
MIKKTEMNKKLPFHLPSSKEDVIVVASQATDHLIVKIKTRFPKKSGPSMRSNPASHIQASENANTNNNTSTRSQPQGNSNASQWAGVHLRFYQASTNVNMHSFGQ